MNKKELARLLFQRKDIRALFESRRFDASTLKRVISEEIMREAFEEIPQDSDFVIDTRPSEENISQMTSMIEDLKATLDEFKGRLADVKKEFTQARTDRDRQTQRNLADEKRMITSDIDRLEVEIRGLEAELQIAYKAAGKSPAKEDDVQVARIAKAVKDVVTQASDNLEQSKDTPENVEKIVKSTTAKLDTAAQKSKEVAKKAQSAPTPQPTVDYNKTIDAIKKIKTPQATTSNQVSTELISKNTGIGFTNEQANKLIMNPIVAAVRRLSFLAGVTFGIENLTIEDVMYYVSGIEAYSPRAAEARKKLVKTVSPQGPVDQLTSMNKQKRSAAISKMEGKELEIVRTIIQRELDAAKSKLSAGGVSMKPFAEQEAGSSAPPPQEPGTPEAPPTKPQGRISRGGVKLASKAIDGENVETSSITPADVKAAVEQDSEEIKSNPEKAQNAKDLMQQVQAPEEETPPEPPAEDPDDTQDAGRPWGDARKAARAKVTAETRPEDIEKALSSPKEFIEFFNPRGDKVGTKMRQIEELFNDKFFEEEIAKIRAKAQEATKAPPEQKSEKTQIVIDDAADLMGTYVAFDQYLEQLPDDYEIQAVSDAVRDFLPTSTPKSADEFDQDFLGPIDDEITGGEGVDTDSNFDFSQKREQLIKRAESTLPYLGIEDTAILDNKPFMIFMGTVLEKEGLISEQEETAQSYVDRYIPEIENEETRKEYFLKPEEAGELVQFLNTNKEQVDGIIAKAIKGSTEDPNAAAKDVIENTPEVEPDADADLSPLATEEMDAAWTTTLDVFFGKSREKSSFMRQFLLKNQASMLYGMIDVLEQITTGGAGGEERSLSNEKTQVKQKEQPAPPPAEAEKEKETSKTDTTSTDAPADEEENVVGGSLEEQVINEIFGMFGGKDNEDKEIKFSPKSTSLMRQDLEAMVDLLRSLKTDIGQYKKYSTSSSVDPRFDGSTLKRAMDAKLKVVQQSIAHLTKVIDIEVQSQKDQLKADGAQAGQDSDDLQEATGSDRKVRIAEVEKVYNEMRRQYLKGLKVSLSTNDAEKAKAGAKELKDYVMGQETFMSYFPSNIITSSGGVMTLGAAHESMVAIIAPFIETIRDIVTITKTQKVSESNLQQAIGNLVMISDSIESMFKVPSLIDREFMKKYIEAAKQNPENQPLTDEEPGMMDKARELAGELTGKALDKLKQMFSWMSNETRKLLLKFFGEDSELIDGLSSSDLSEEQQEALVEDIVESKTWYQNLEQDAKSAVDALVKYLINEVGRDSLKQLNYPAVVSEKLNDDERRTISNFAQETQETFGKELSNRTYKFLHAADEDIKVSSMKLMVEETDDLVSYLTTIFKIVDKISKEAAEEMVSPQTATITQGDQDPNVEDEVPEPENLGKDNSELEDVDGFDDSEKTDDSGTPEDEDDIADFNREVESVDEFLPRLKKPTNPIAKQIQPIKDGFVDVLSKQKKIPVRRATEMFNKFFLLIFKQMNKDLVMEDKDQFAKTLIPKIKQDTKRFISSLGSDELKIRDFNIFFKNIKEADLIKLIALIRKHKVKIAKIVYGEKGQVSQDNSEKPVRGQEVTLQEALRPIIEKMLNEHYNH